MEHEEWTMIIRPQRRWFDLRLGELWRARDLIKMFVWRDFAAQYKQTILGPLWFLIAPLITTITFTVVFGNIARLPTDGLPPFLFYMTGTTIWNYFAACLGSTSNTFIANSGLFGKVYFPRLSVPISTLISNLFKFSIQFGQLLAFLIYFMVSGSDVRITAWITLLPLLVLMMAGFGLGMGIIVSSLTTRYRDLHFLVGFGVQLMMYATPVIYPLSSIPERWRWLISLNQLSPIVEGFRLALLGTGSLDPAHLLYSVSIMAIALMIGFLIFNRVESTFMDTV